MSDDSSIKIKDLTKQVKILKKLIKDMNKQMIEDKQKVFPLLAKVSDYDIVPLPDDIIDKANKIEREK